MTSALEARLQNAYAAESKLLSLHMDLVYACDLDCCHCYLDDKRTETLTTSKILKTLEEARALGALKLTLSGGELFLRKDLIPILEHARNLGFYLKLKTHGGLLTEELADAMKRFEVNRIDISVYSVREDIHDFITRRRGSLQRTMEGIERLIDREIPVRVNCSVMNINLREYKELHTYFHRLGVDVSIDGSIRGTNGGGTETYALGLTVAEKAELEEFKRKLLARPAKAVEMDPEEHICWAGKTSAHIQPDGTVTPCVAWPMALGNVQDRSLRSIWTEPEVLHEIRSIRRKDLDGCSSCALKSRCTFCPGKAFVETNGGWREPFSLQCQDTAARAFGTLRTNAKRFRDGVQPILRGTARSASVLQPSVPALVVSEADVRSTTRRKRANVFLKMRSGRTESRRV